MYQRIGLISLGLMLVAALGTISAPGQDLLDVNDDDEASSLNESALGLALIEEPSGDLSTSEEEGLLFMIEEEKLAGDVYQALNERWDLRVFDNIGRAERTHEDAVRTLLLRYSLPDSTAGVGVFSNETLQGLYDDLVWRGNASIEDALRTGAIIEEIDILDLEERMDQTDREDILLVYSNLRKGSENHLRAFVNNLQRRGFEYTPQNLSQERYDGIINA